VKKIAVEVKKHSQDITNIVTSLGTITKELSDLKKKAATCCPMTANTCHMNPEITVSPVEATHDVQDNDSVKTEDVKNLLSDIPSDGDDDIVNEVIADDPAVMESQPSLEEPPISDQPMPTNYKSMSVDELKNESYEDLKRFCRSEGLSTKGTKDALIARIKA
jgi:hypothetical protein